MHPELVAVFGVVEGGHWRVDEWHPQERNPSAAVYLGQSLSSRLEKGVNVQVLLRCRPFSDGELRNNTPHVVTCNDYQREVVVSQNIVGKQIDRVFTFDKVN
ncbi:Kinesin-like protein KIN-5C [Linum perenne]